MALTPEEIAEKEFALGLRGYDKDEVRSYLQTVAVGLREAIDAAAASSLATATHGPSGDAKADKPEDTAKADEPESGTSASDGPAAALVGAAAEPPDWSSLGEEIASVLRTAHEQASGLRAAAESEAATVRGQAQQDAEAAREAAERDRAEAETWLEQAQSEALDLVAGAQSRIDDRLAKAKETANREAVASVAELSAQIAQLTNTRDEVRAELTTLRSRLDDTISTTTSGEKVSAS